MPSFRTDRIAEDIKREMALIFRELKDPRLQGMISIVRIKVAPDLSNGKVFISSMDGIEAARGAVQGLKSASGFIKRELIHRLDIRRCPDFEYVPDDSIEHSAQISKMIDELK